MNQLLSIDQIKARADAIGVSLKVLAKEAEVSPAVAYRGAKGEGDNRSRTLRALTDALVARETKVREHLEKLPREAAA